MISVKLIAVIKTIVAGHRTQWIPVLYIINFNLKLLLQLYSVTIGQRQCERNHLAAESITGRLYYKRCGVGAITVNSDTVKTGTAVDHCDKGIAAGQGC